MTSLCIMNCIKYILAFLFIFGQMTYHYFTIIFFGKAQYDEDNILMTMPMTPLERVVIHLELYIGLRNVEVAHLRLESTAVSRISRSVEREEEKVSSVPFLSTKIPKRSSGDGWTNVAKSSRESETTTLIGKIREFF